MCFMQSFVEAAISCGIKTKKQYYFPNKKIENKIIHCADTILTLINKYLPFLIRKKKAIIITAAGDTIFKESFPYFYNSEIIPMLWDVWPARWEGISYNLQYLQCKLCFVTVRSVAERIKKEIGINAYWIPEGICITDYQKGVPLAIRKNDILELGRQHVFYHNILERLERENQIHGYARNSYYPNGNYKTLAFPKVYELIEALPTFNNINEADDKWVWEVVKNNLENYEVTYEEIQEEAKIIFGENFNKQLPQEENSSFEYNKETNMYIATEVEFDQEEDSFLLDNIKKVNSEENGNNNNSNNNGNSNGNGNSYVVEIVEYLEDYSNEDSVIIKTTNEEEIGRVAISESETKIQEIVKNNKDRFTKKKVYLKTENNNLIIEKVEK